MTLRTGREFLSIPGPTNVPDEVLRAMHRPAVDLYSGPLLKVTETCLADLKTIFRTEGRTYIYAANGHGAWEAALSNTLSRDDTVLVLASGRFAQGWGEMGKMLGVDVEVLENDWRSAVDPAAVETRLRADSAGEIKAILVVQIDTASGVQNDIPAIRAAIDAARHPALLMVDAVASVGCVPYEMDAWRVDLTMTGSQKGLMVPPGLGFVAAGPRAMEAHKTADLRTLYWDWTFRDGPEHYMKYCGTAPEHLLFGLRQALDMIFAEGLEAIWHRHAVLADATRAAVATWADGGAFGFNVLDPDKRSNSVTTIRMAEGRDPQPLIDFCNEQMGVVLGVGIGDLGGKAFRIAHMGYCNAPMVLGTLGSVEVALQALGWPHGKGGIQAATEIIAKALSAPAAEECQELCVFGRRSGSSLIPFSLRWA